MAVLTDNNPRWLGNFDSLVIDVEGLSPTAKDVDVEIYISDAKGVRSTTFTEKHFVQDGKVVMTDLQELVSAYCYGYIEEFVNVVDMTLFALDPVASVRFRVYSVGHMLEERSFAVVLSGVQMPQSYVIDGEPSSFGDKFLSRRKTVRLPENGIGSVSTFSRGSIRVSVFYERPDMVREVVVEENDTQSAGVRMRVLPITWHHVYSLFSEVKPNVDKSRIVGAKIELVVGSAVKDTVTFYRDKSHKSNLKTFLFMGAMGQPEVLHLVGKEQIEPELNGQFVKLGNNYEKVRTDFAVEHKSYTGPLSESERDTIYDMAASPKVWLIGDDDSCTPVTITAIDFTEELPHREPIGLMVQWRVSDNKMQRVYSHE